MQYWNVFDTINIKAMNKNRDIKESYLLRNHKNIQYNLTLQT